MSDDGAAAADALFEELSNEGRWGPDDELGTLNFITEAKVIEAVGLIRRGRTVSIGRDLDTVQSAENPRPVVHRMLYGGPETVGAADLVEIAPHGFTVTHVDAPSHVFYDGRTYNGRTVAGTVLRDGIAFGSIHALRDGIVTRGVLLDVAAATGADFLDDGTAIGPDLLEAAEIAAGIEVATGDAVLVRCGRTVREQRDPPAETLVRAGLDVDGLRWLHSRKAALFGGDCIERLPSPHPGLELPLHQLGLAAMGLILLDWPDVDALADACRDHGTHEFALFVAPLRLPGGTGSAVNPICVF